MNWKRKLLKDIKFPVYPIRSYDKLWEENNILYIDTGCRVRIIDNKNFSGSFGNRRAQVDPKELYRLQSLPTIKSLIKYKSINNIFIDSTGELFKYTKTKMVPLVYKKIIKREKVEGLGYLIWVSDIDNPFHIPAVYYDPFVEYARILLTGNFGPMLYDFTTKSDKDTRRKI